MVNIFNLANNQLSGSVWCCHVSSRHPTIPPTAVLTICFRFCFWAVFLSLLNFEFGSCHVPRSRFLRLFAPTCSTAPAATRAAAAAAPTFVISLGTPTFFAKRLSRISIVVTRGSVSTPANRMSGAAFLARSKPARLSSLNYQDAALNLLRRLSALQTVQCRQSVGTSWKSCN